MQNSDHILAISYEFRQFFYLFITSSEFRQSTLNIYFLKCMLSYYSVPLMQCNFLNQLFIFPKIKYIWIQKKEFEVSN